MKKGRVFGKSIESWTQKSEMVLSNEYMNKIRGGDGDDGTPDPVPPPPPPPDESN